MPPPSSVRFLTIPQVAAELATTKAHVTALVRRGDLPALKLDGRGQWRIERAKLEEFITRTYTETKRLITEGEGPTDDLADGTASHRHYEHDEDYRQEEGGEG